MTTVALEQAQKDLPALISEVAHGEHVVITRDNVPVAELVPVSRVKVRPIFGNAKGMVHMSEDFDAPLEDFREYME